MQDSGAQVLTIQAPLSEMGMMFHSLICWSAWMVLRGLMMVETELVAMASWTDPLADMSTTKNATVKMPGGFPALRYLW